MTIALGKFTKDESDLFNIMDDWLRRDRFVFVGWYNLFQPANSLAHSLLLLWGLEAQGDLTRWCQLGGLWTFVALHGAFGLIGFMLRQFELARSVQLQTYNAIAFSAPIFKLDTKLLPMNEISALSLRSPSVSSRLQDKALRISENYIFDKKTVFSLFASHISHMRLI
ncbi:unnamed protein product, partial [Vitis vinifera]|uniref:Photosystem II D2 protein n=1 Tax=Vitis vinifera TaxID=29760 RepID=D7ST76_VITVI